jgi:mycofactocin glycosyltransferase
MARMTQRAQHLLADPSLLITDEGRLLAGGHPGRVVRLSSDGAEIVRRWFGGHPVDSAPALADKLVDAGIAHPYLAPEVGPVDVTIVVPVHDSASRLDRCLAALRADQPDLEIVVVDDASPDPAGIVEVAHEHKAVLVRSDVQRGAAAARNLGLAGAQTPYVAFVDCDVVVSPGWLAALVPYVDGDVVAAAPRIVAYDESGNWLADYEAAHSPLDMGPRPGRVAPGAPVPYVPSAVLLARRDALVDGFDEALPIGEDIDLEWRLVANGHAVRYVPQVTVTHDHRTELGEFARRRRTYARSVGLLSARHPDALPATRVHPALAAACVLAAARRPGLAGVVTAAAAANVARKLRGTADRPHVVAAQLTARALPATGLGLARAVERCWWPVLAVPAIRNRQARRLLALSLLWPAITDWRDAKHRPGVLPYAAGRTAAGVATTVGTWEGCVEGRTLRPLLPSFSGSRRAGKARRAILRTTLPN